MVSLREASTSTRMETNKKLVFQIARVIALIMLLGCASADGTPQGLRRADLLHWLGCLTQKESMAGFSRSFSGSRGLLIRFVYGIRDDVDKRDTDIFLIVYEANRRKAAYYEISVNAPDTGGRLVFRTAGSLRKYGGNWVLDDALGGMATRSWAQKMVDRVSQTELQVIPLTEISTPVESCWWKPSATEKR